MHSRKTNLFISNIDILFLIFLIMWKRKENEFRDLLSVLIQYMDDHRLTTRITHYKYIADNVYYVGNDLYLLVLQRLNHYSHI